MHRVNDDRQMKMYIFEPSPFEAEIPNANLKTIKSTIFWDVALCSPLKVNQRFGGTYRLHLQNLKSYIEKYKSPGMDQIPAEPIQAVGETLPSEVHNSLILFGIK
jgi:hypothetical protein